MASVAGCSAAAAPLTPRMAISLAADKTQSVTSMVVTFSDQISGAVTIQGTGGNSAGGVAGTQVAD